MTDPERPLESTETQASGQPRGTIAVSMSYVKSPRGIIKIVEFFLLLVAFSSAADCCGSSFNFFLFASVLSWIFVTLIFLAYFFCIVQKIPQINWDMSVFINSIIWGILMLVASSLLANSARVSRPYRGYLGGSVYSAIVFGFFSVVAFVVDTVIHYQIVRA